MSKLPEEVEEAKSLEAFSVTPEIGFDAHHVQGLVVTDKYFYFTSVEKANLAGWMFKVDRKTMKLVGKRNHAKFADIHPGGIDYDGKYIWMAMAVYTERSHAYIMIVDPETLKAKTKFEVKDHIGAVARHEDMVIGANWDAEEFYFWTLEGKLVDKRESPTGIGYQDCKGEGGWLACVGGGFLDWIDVDRWKLAKRFPLGKSLEGSPLSREGVALFGGRAFFLPDDGPTARIYEYEFSKEEEKKIEDKNPNE
ncbi:MAG: DUF6454 family protein [bacterium]